MEIVSNDECIMTFCCLVSVLFNLHHTSGGKTTGKFVKRKSKCYQSRRWLLAKYKKGEWFEIANIFGCIISSLGSLAVMHKKWSKSNKLI